MGGSKGTKGQCIKGTKGTMENQKERKNNGSKEMKEQWIKRNERTMDQKE